LFTARYGLIAYIEQTTFGLYITTVESVYSAVRTGSFYKADYVWSLNNRGGKCLQRGTDWFLIQSGLCLVFKGLMLLLCVRIAWGVRSLA
jgi:hypothetical protein